MKTIKRLRIRMTILVSAVLIIVTAGIVFFINYMNWHNITSQAERALATLSENSGSRPGLSGEEGPPELPDMEQGRDMQPPEKPGQDESEGSGGGLEGGRKPGRGQPPQIEDALATMSNYYVVTLADDGTVESWTSDRDFLYTDDQVSDMTAMAIESGRNSGRIGTQFYTTTKNGGNDLLIVLDERLEIMTAQRVLRLSAMIAAAACLLLCIGAYFLIRAMVRPVQDAFEKQRQFVWDASHELKTPLAVIGANAQVLQGEIGENESLTYITDEVRRTDRMIRNLLMLAETDRGEADLHLTRTDLGEVVLSAVLPMESAAFDAGRQIETQIEDQVICTGSEDLLRQLTVILLSNAVKYADEGTQIMVTVDRRGKEARLRVADTGAGISPEEQKHIFDRFYRADSSHSREVEGHGLGLAIAQNIVQIHKGKISVASEAQDAGRFLTTFTVTLP